MNQYRQLFASFFKIGAFTIGGGYAMIPLIQKEVVTQKKWIDADEFIALLSLAQSAPGPIAVNTAIFVGYKVRGINYYLRRYFTIVTHYYPYSSRFYPNTSTAGS